MTFTLITLTCQAGEMVPPFCVESSLNTEVLGPNDPEPFFSACAEVRFRFTEDGIWEMEMTSAEDPQSSTTTGSSVTGIVVNCRSIVDGVRLLMVPEDMDPANATNPAPFAMAYPIHYPPPEQTQLLVAWMTFVPQPSLPIVGPGEIRRFLSTEVQGHPLNRGTFEVRYLNPGELFVASLTVHNGGIVFSGIGEPRRLTAPHDAGWIEHEFEVVKTTNWAGFSFPIHSELRVYGASAAPDGRPTRYLRARTELRVRSIQSPGTERSMISQRFPRVLGLDRRPPDLGSHTSIDYWVTNDMWQPVTNRELVGLAQIYREAGRKNPHTRWAVRGLFAIMLLSLPSVLFLRWNRQRGARAEKNNG